MNTMQQYGDALRIQELKDAIKKILDTLDTVLDYELAMETIECMQYEIEWIEEKNVY